MPSPFPGMDPYLEAPALWPNVHTSLIVALRDDIAPRLRPHYYVAVEERTIQLLPDDLMVVTRPDVAVVQAHEHATTLITYPSHEHEHAPNIITVEVPVPDEIREVYLEIRTTQDDRVITVVEFLSPANKLVGEGRRHYERKRLELFGTLTHVVEIDLLRAGKPMPMRGYHHTSDYRLLISRASQRPYADLVPFSVRQAIPDISLPLQAGDEEPCISLNQMLHMLYERAGYDLRIDYRAAPPPPSFSAEDAQWIDERLRAAGVR